MIKIAQSLRSHIGLSVLHIQLHRQPIFKLIKILRHLEIYGSKDIIPCFSKVLIALGLIMIAIITCSSETKEALICLGGVFIIFYGGWMLIELFVGWLDGAKFIK